MELLECAEFLRRHDNFILLTHRRPDGDTLGSAAGLCHALRRLGKTAWLFPNPEITETFLPLVEPYLAPAGYRWDTAVCADVADAPLICAGYEGSVDLWLDHHLSRSERPNSVVWPHKASCGELILELIEALGLVPDREEADLLYMAVATDTGCFLYANTNAQTHRAAARLLEAGADLPGLNKIFFRTKSRARLLLEGMICAGIRSYKNDQLNIAVVTLDMLDRCGATEDDCNDLANLAGLVRGNRLAVTVRELSAEPPVSKISLRTDGAVDASAVCGKFGGGGHRMAAGCELSLPPEEAAEVIRAAVEEAWA